MGKRLIVVPNENLMNNHQVQLTFELGKEQYVKYARGKTSNELRTQLLEVLSDPKGFSLIKKFPPKESNRIALHLQKELHCC
jgi:UDP-N-acetylglucosamine transferase subunit ALG13